MYDINKVYLYEVFEEYRLADEQEKDAIWNDFCATVWQTPNNRQKYTKNICYRILDSLPNDEFIQLFEKYKSIPFTTYKARTRNVNSWHLLKQRINNLYTNSCDKDVCLRKEYFYELGTAKRLYYSWLAGDLNISVDDICLDIKNSLMRSQEVKDKYTMQKMNLSWKQYKEIVNGFLHKCLNNYTPLSEKEDDTVIILNIDFWMEDNYVVRYVGDSISKYLKNYEKKEYYGICRKNTRDKRVYKRCIKCGNLFLTRYKKLCENCSIKKVVCIDCGNEFMIDVRNMKKFRCDTCQRLFRMEWDRNRKRKLVP